MDVTIGRREFRLLAGGGVYWPAERALLVADTHFGKEATFRRASIAVPAGSTAGTIDSLSAMIGQTDPDRVVFLGDLFHAKTSLSESIRRSVGQFLRGHDGIEFVLVRGNHDAATGRLPDDWSITDVGPRWRLHDVALEHFPADPPEGCSLLMCGHLHPAVRLRHGDDKMGKLPCFWLAGETLVLPAMGEFTGTATIDPRPGDRVWVTAGDAVIEHRHEVARKLGRRQRAATRR